MEHRVLRTFHPVGQGAFYSERHTGFNIIYDCGSMPLSSMAKSVVESAFNKNDVIDALFISHFDYDHVSAISVLKNTVGTIKTVVMPLLHDEHRHLLININRALSHNILKLLINPQSFFGKETTIVYVKPSENEEFDNNPVDNSPERHDIREIRRFQNKVSGNVEIESGTKLSLGGSLGWVFVPFNFCNPARSSQLEYELSEEKFDVKQLKSNPKYSLNAIADKSSRKALRKVYSRVDGNVNENSLLIYSGPDSSIEKEKWLTYSNYYFIFSSQCCDDKVGCIYTGDSDLNKLNLNSIYSEFADNVGVLQIPHHGSKHNFSINSVKRIRPGAICPISFGTKNNYGHPASEVMDVLLDTGYEPLPVTEHLDTEFSQTIVIVKKKVKRQQQSWEAF